jgi:hypothetical protein
MNFIKNQSSVFVIAGIMAVVTTAFLIVVPVTPTVLIAYVFTLLAIGLFTWGNLQLLDSAKSYPWFAAFPMRIWQYLTAQLVLSAVFIGREYFFEGEFSIALFFFLHIAILGYFAVSLVLMKPAAEIIETRETEVKQKVSVMRLMQADIESVLRQHPEHEEPLKRVLEALKYSDPMSHPSVGIHEEEIQRSILAMSGLDGNDPAKIPAICETLLKQIDDRNSRVKLMK